MGTVSPMIAWAGEPADNQQFADWLRAVASNVEAGIYGGVDALAMIVVKDHPIGFEETLLQTVRKGSTLDTYRLVGIYHAAMHKKLKECE
jgi:hypothetical protein